MHSQHSGLIQPYIIQLQLLWALTPEVAPRRCGASAQLLLTVVWRGVAPVARCQWHFQNATRRDSGVGVPDIGAAPVAHCPRHLQPVARTELDTGSHGMRLGPGPLWQAPHRPAERRRAGRAASPRAASPGAASPRVACETA